ncbi:MAG: iron export ABC transporter permease subunit FetB [Pirellulales bacterium]
MNDNGYIALTYTQLALAASLLVLNAVISTALGLGIRRALLWAAVRMTSQLLLIGLVLKWIFDRATLPWVLAMGVVMVMIAAASGARRLIWHYPSVQLDLTVAVWASSWLIAAAALGCIVQPEPWYQPSVAIPILGMILGNSLNGVTICLERLGGDLLNNRDRVETLLSLGATRWEAARETVATAVRAGMIPIINAMSIAGVVSLPGMMTGQLLSGVEPVEAVKYQIAIFFLIAAAIGLGTTAAALLAYSRLFNTRHQFLHRRITRRNGS